MAKIHVLGGMGYDSNIFLVEDDDPILIDAGTRYHLRRNVEDIEEILPMTDIGSIVLTHRHYDHTGGAAELAKRSGAAVYIHRDDANSVRIGDSVSTGARNFDDDQERVDVEILEEGQELSTGHFDFMVLHTPGHTVGSISLYDVEHRVLISGDTVFTNGGVGRWDLPTGNYDHLVASIKLLSRLEVDALYPGHMAAVAEGGSEHVKIGLRNLTEFTKEELLLSRIQPLLEHSDDILKMIEERKQRVTDVKTKFEIE